MSSQAPTGIENIEAYNATQADRDAVRLEDIGPLNVDIPAATSRACAAATRCSRYAADLAQLPVPADLLARVTRYGLAAAHAHVLHLAAEAPTPEITQMAEELYATREMLIADAKALIGRKLIPAERISKLSGTRGHRDLGFDIMLLCTVFRDEWPALAGRTALRVEELDPAQKLAERLVAAVALRDDREKAKSRAHQERARAFHLLSLSYDQLRRCLSFILWGIGDLNDVAPAFIMGRARGVREDIDADAVGGPTPNGASTPVAGGVIFDPLRQRYFRIDSTAAALLTLWPAHRTVDQLADAANELFGLAVSGRDVTDLQEFLTVQGLVVPADERGWRHLGDGERRSQTGWLAWAMHNYLFIRIPLIQPQPILDRLAPWLAPLYTRAFAMLIAVFGASGIYLASRQWDTFLGTFLYFFSLEGALLYGLSLAIVKSLHELGHAATAHRFGCRVPTMGICFMVLVPMLYTDVSDAWRLSSRRQRVAIDAAGLIVETGLACLATFAWAFLPDGMLRSLAFAIATTGWLLSLGLNLNPFMRFDGYYLLSDLTGIENLQPRAFALATWRLRELLFALRAPPPEHLPAGRRRWLVAYAWATWIYRLVVFTGIALLVYHMAFKLLGIALFLVEIIYFIAWPVWREIKEWHTMRSEIIAARRGIAVLALLSVVIAAALVPWATRISIPAVLEDAGIQQAFPRRSGEIKAISVRRGQRIEAGQPIAEIASPELDHEIRQAGLRVRLIESRLARRTADVTDRSESPVLEDALLSLRARLAGLNSERAELRIVALHAGTVTDLDGELQAGRWVQRTDLIALVRAGAGIAVRGYIGEEDVVRLDPTVPARFIPEDLTQPVRNVRVERIAAAASSTLDITDLSSHYGGGVAARPLQRAGEGRVHVPVTGQFLIAGYVEGAPTGETARVVRGTLHIAGRPESLAARAWRQVLKVLVRESGM